MRFLFTDDEGLEVIRRGSGSVLWKAAGRESGELECISGQKQVVHCCNWYLREGRILKGERRGEREGGGLAFAANCC